MPEKYEKFSYQPRYTFDSETWELIVIENEVSITLRRIEGVLMSNTQESDNYSARQVWWKVGEAFIKNLLREHLSKNRKFRNLFDIDFGDGKVGEIKTARVWWKCIIIQPQLEKMPKSWFYCLVYYRVEWFANPTSALAYAREKKLQYPERFLRSKIKIHSVFVFPRSDLVHFFNTTKNLKYPIRDNKWGQEVKYYLWIWIENARLIFRNNEWDFSKNIFTFLSSQWPVPVFLTWFSDIKL